MVLRGRDLVIVTFFAGPNSGQRTADSGQRMTDEAASSSPEDSDQPSRPEVSSLTPLEHVPVILKPPLLRAD